MTKIFMAVAVAMFAFACVTDTTEDLGIEVGKGGVTEITVSLEESRTQLGEKADGKYPLYWSEGDQIAINGVASAALTEGGNAAATFSFGEVLTTPYNIVYPASEGANVVNFLAVQPYTVGTFAPKAAPMYGYSEGVPTEGVQLNHLTGVLRFAVKGSDKLASLTLTAEGKIAGNFDIDCTSGALTAHEDALNSVTVTFGGGLQLTDEATPIYVAVPAGSHGLYTITLTSTDGKAMVVKYDSDAKPVKVGVVKEFGEILYAPSEVADPEGELVIVSESDMLRLQKWAADGKLANVTKVTIGATIDMSGVADWQPIAGFPAIEFDGGSEAGYVISGLKAPLFATVEGATIQNVKLTSVNITETERLYVGSLVCNAITSTVNNCSAAGTLTYNNTTASIVGGGNTTYGIGGVVGCTYSSTVSNCSNSVNITVEKYAAKSDAAIYCGTGGVIGLTNGDTETTKVRSTVSNCTNVGNISVLSHTSSINPALGGVIGYCYYSNVSNVVNGKQDADDKGCLHLVAKVNAFGMGGIVGAMSASDVDTATNYGDIKFDKGSGYPYAGGAFGTLFSSTGTVKNVDNYGTISVPNVAFSNGTPYLGGVIGRMAGTKWTIDDCDNYVDLVIEANFSAIKSNNMSCFGGIIGGTIGGTVKNCDNYANLSVKGTFGNVSSASTYGGSLYVGGIVGRMDEAASVIENCHNGNIDAATPTSLSVDVEMGGLPYIAGVAGHFMGNSLKNCGNHANITIKGKSGGHKDTKAPHTTPVFGGVIGFANNSNLVVDNCDNLHNGDTEANHIAMNITFTTAGHIVFGGCFGSLTLKSAANCDNNCPVTANITLGATSDSATVLGGLAGKMGAKATSCTNGPLGDITVTGSAKANVGVSGLNCSTNATENCSNAGDVVMSVDQSAGGSAYINGLHWTGSGSAAHKNFTNSGNITYSGKCTVNVFMSGAGYTPTGTWTNVQNTGTLTANVTGLAATLKIGGLTRSSSTATFNGCGNSGDIVFKGTSTKAVYLGGLAGDINGAFKTAEEGYANTFVNSGDIKFLGTTTSTAYVAGVAGSATVDVGAIKVVKNTGLVTNYDAEEGLTGSAADLRIGGVLGHISAAFTHAVENSGNLYVRKAESAKAAYIGGVVGLATKTITGATMTGDVVAIGFTESAAAPIVGVGMIIGSHRSSTTPQASSCVIGGRLALEEMDGNPLYRTISQVVIGIEDTDTGNIEPDPHYIPYWEKIYGGTWAEASATNCDNCTPHSTAPSSAEM
ncbi:MAG: hypothetical protein IKB90_03270 [Alistipes sp.]|nr:hypothetical protein [Alistipes sp.]